MERKELICIGCPLGCSLTATLKNGNITVSGNTCKRGEEYGRKEVTAPSRTVTSSVRVKNGDLRMVSVKTQSDIPKDKIFECMEEIHRITVEAPVAVGNVIIKDCAGTGIPVIATRDVKYNGEKAC